MVLLKVKASEDEQFLYRTSIRDSVEATRRALVEIYNLHQKVRRLKIAGEELAKYGQSKEPNLQGIDTYQEDPVPKGEFYDTDPSGRRNGNACHPTAKATLIKALEDASQLILKSQVTAKQEVTIAELRDAIDQIRGAVLIGYPMGLPEWDPVRLLLENKDDEAESYGHEQFALENTVLWFAGKELQVGSLLSQYLGKNDNTTAILRLTRKDQGAPSREPVIDEATYKGMLSWTYKKQEQQKALDENQEDVYLESEWANTKSLKQHLSGISRIRI